MWAFFIFMCGMMFGAAAAELKASHGKFTTPVLIEFSIALLFYIAFKLTYPE